MTTEYLAIAMHSKGMNVKDIADILALSEIEVKNILKIEEWENSKTDLGLPKDEKYYYLTKANYMVGRNKLKWKIDQPVKEETRIKIK